MDDTNLGFVLTLISLLIVLVGFSFQMGRKYEERFWKKAIPDQMTKLCLECAGLSR